MCSGSSQQADNLFVPPRHGKGKGHCHKEGHDDGECCHEKGEGCCGEGHHDGEGCCHENGEGCCHKDD